MPPVLHEMAVRSGGAPAPLDSPSSPETSRDILLSIHKRSDAAVALTVPGFDARLVFSWDDCVRHHYVAETSGLAQTDARSLPSLFCDDAGSVLKEVGADRLRAALLALSSNNRGGGGSSEYSASALLRLHDRLTLVSPPSAEAVDSRDLVAALCLYCSGSKSEKLQLLFSVFCEDGTGVLSRVGLWRLLRAVLAALSCLSMVLAPGEELPLAATAALRRRLDTSAALCASTSFEWLQSAEAAAARSHMDFESFAEAYNEYSHSRLLWLEMLDQRKWPEPPFAQETADTTPLLAAGAPLLACPLAPPDVRGDAPRLVLSTAHVQRFVELVPVSQVPGSGAGGEGSVSLGDLVESLVSEADDGLSEEGMMAGLRSCGLIGDDTGSGAFDVGRLAYARAIFGVLARPEGRAEPVDVAAALSFLLPGADKSSKLAALWDALAGDGQQGALSRRGLWRLLRALLAALLVLATDEWPPSRGAVLALAAAADAAAVEATASVFLQTAGHRASDEALALEEFAEHYNAAATGGEGDAGTCSWLELLDARKWAAVLERAAGVGVGAAPAASASSDAASGLTPSLCVRAVLPCAFIFDIPLAAAEAPLRVSRGACEWLVRVAAGTGLADAPLGLLADVLDESLSGEADWQERIVHPGSDVTALVEAIGARVGRRDTEADASLELYLRRFRAAAEATSGGAATGADVWVGLLVLTGAAESKSRKLELAFATLSGSGAVLPAPRLCGLLRALLLAFACVQEQGAALDLATAVAAGLPVAAAVEPWSSVLDAAAATATACTIAIAGESAGDAESGGISLGRLMGWYNAGGGMADAVFLELLGHDRWRLRDGSGAVSAPPPPLQSHRCLTLLLSPVVPRSYPALPVLLGDPADDLAVFEFSLPTHGVEEDEAENTLLSVSLWDGVALQQLSEALGLGGVAPDVVASAVLALPRDAAGCVSLQQLLLGLADCGASPRIGGPLSDVSALVLAYFSAFTAAAATLDRSADGRLTPVPAAVALVAALLISSGSKSSKLATSWAAFTAASEGEASHAVLASWLHVWLAALIAVKAAAAYIGGAGGELAAASQLARAHAEFIADTAFAAFADQDGSLPPALTFADFSAYFNAAPDGRLAWLEALDLAKLPSACRRRGGLAALLGLGPAEVGDEDEEDSKLAPNASQAPASDAGQPQRGHGGAAPVVGVPPGSSAVTARAAVHAVSLALWSGLLALLPDVVHDVVLSSADPAAPGADAAVAREAFDELLGDVREAAEAEQPPGLAQCDSKAGGERHALSLAWLFDACAGRTGAERAPALIVATALSSFCRGSKSDKLAAAFSAAGARGAGKSPEQQAAALRDALAGLLIGLTCLLGGPSLDPPAALASARGVAERALARVSASSAERSASAEEAAPMPLPPSFEDLCAVYNASVSALAGGGGRASSPPPLGWVELLDLRKLVLAGEEPVATTVETGAATHDDPIAASLAPPSEDWLSGTVYSLELTSVGDLLRVSRRDILALEALTQAAGFGGIGVEEVFFAAETATDGSGTVDADGFVALYRALAGGSTPPLDALIDAVFRVLRDVVGGGDDTGSGVAPRNAAAALALFAAGTKSEKLCALFEVFADEATSEDDGSSGCLNSAQFQELLRAALAPLLVFGSLNEASPYATPASVAAVCAMEIADAVFGTLRGETESETTDAAASEEPRVLSFETFATLYNAGIHASRAGFLELLSAKKWVLDDFAAGVAEAQYAQVSEGPIAPAASQPPRAESDVVFALPILSGSGESTTLLQIRTADLEHVQAVLDAVRFDAVTLRDVYEAFAAHAHSSDGTVDKPAFNRAVRSLLPGDRSVDSDERRLVSCALSSLFYGLTGGGAVADATAAATAVSALVRASKSAKVAEAWAHFDADSDGRVSFGELSDLLASLLTAVLALCAPAPLGAGEPASSLTFVDRTEVRSAAAASVRGVCAALGLCDTALLSFEDVSRAYGAGGGVALSWLELADLHKAVERGLTPVRAGSSKLAPSAAAPSGSVVPATAEGEDSTQSDARSTANAAVFVFPLRGTAAAIRMWPADVQHFRDIVECFGGGAVTAAELLRVVNASCASAAVGPGGTVPLDAFQTALRALVPGAQSLPDGSRRLLSATFGGAHTVFSAVAGEGVGATAADLLVPLLFCIGGSSKSEKLLAAFNAYSDSGSSGVTLPSLARLLRSVLLSLVIFRSPVSAGSGGGEHAEATVGDILVAAEGYAELAFSAVGTAPPKTLSFEQFAVFYSSHGFAVLPFLELLSLRKFIPPEAIEPSKAIPSTATEARPAAVAWAPSDTARAAVVVDGVGAQFVASLSGLATQLPSALGTSILRCALPSHEDRPSSVSRVAFFSAVRQLAAERETLSEAEQRDVTRRLNAVYDSLTTLAPALALEATRVSAGSVDVGLAVAALLPLCAGGVESKLQAAWRLAAAVEGPISTPAASDETEDGLGSSLRLPKVVSFVANLLAGLAVHGPGPVQAGSASWATLGATLRHEAEAVSRAIAAVQSGGVPEGLEGTSPGEIHESFFLRWYRDSQFARELFAGLNPRD